MAKKAWGRKCRFSVEYAGIEISGKGRIVDTGSTYENVHIIEVERGSIPVIVRDYFGDRIAIKKSEVKF